MAKISVDLGFAISAAEDGRITRSQLLEVFQEAIDNGTILEERNQIPVIASVMPLIDQGVLRRSPHIDSFENRMNEQVGRRVRSIKKGPAKIAREQLEWRGIDIESLIEQLRGKPFSYLVQEQLRKGGGDLDELFTTSLHAFDDLEREIAERIGDEYVPQGLEDSEFWKRDCADLLWEICERFSGEVEAAGSTATDFAKFNIGQLVSVYFASIAINDRPFRRFAGIKKGWLFW